MNTQRTRGIGAITPFDDVVIQRPSESTIEDMKPVIPLLGGANVKLPTEKMMGVFAGYCWTCCARTVSTEGDSLKLAVATAAGGEAKTTLLPVKINPVPERVMAKITVEGNGKGDVTLMFKTFDLSMKPIDIATDDTGNDLSG
jgi:hypothetical protein